MIAIGLDPSLRAYGYAVLSIDPDGNCTIIESGHEATLSSHVPPARFRHFQQLVESLIERHCDVEVIGVESPAFSAGPYQTIHYCLMQFSMLAAYDKRVDCVLFDPATRESLIRGDLRGKIHKSDVQKYVQLDTMSTQILDNNEADAYVIGKFAGRFKLLADSKLRPDVLTPAELRIFFEKTKNVKTAASVKQKKIGHLFRENERFFRFSNIPIGDHILPKKKVLDDDILSRLEIVSNSRQENVEKRKLPRNKKKIL